MITGVKIVNTAKKYIDKGGSIFCKEYGLNYIVNWCVIYVWYVFRKAGACKLFYDCQKVCNVANADSWLRRNATWIKDIKNTKAGDIIIMTWDNGKGNNKRVGSRDHMGIVTGLEGNKVKTIEGNTGSAACNKAKVSYRTRPAANVYAIYRPKYDTSKADKELTKKVKDTLSGKYGTGAERKKALGHDYETVQDEINRITRLTENTLKGDYGTGEDRKKALGSDYDLVQWNITRLNNAKESKKK